jgi:2-polyprenyl-6-methoxyphenol hydroxylase-like FAD-dependent oxidoreductase
MMYSTNNSNNMNTNMNPGSERMRVAIVGGGVSGLSTALHLAPLAARGIIAAPIDVYESSPNVKGRSIGVGIWSTALDSFRESSRPSHQLVWERMTSQGSWIDEVGYRTPQGDWLVHSRLSTHFSNKSNNNNSNNSNNASSSSEKGETSPTSTSSTPGLLFLRESDVHAALRMAVAAEEHLSTIQLHCNSPVTRIDETSPHSWSASLVLEEGRHITSRDYHLIVAADGIHSCLRKTYGGGSQRKDDRRLTGKSQ